MPSALRHLIVILGDQLDRQSLVFDDFDPEQDAVWMCEASFEATHVWSSKPRITLFLSAMRHFRDELLARGFQVIYRELNTHQAASLEVALAENLARIDINKRKEISKQANGLRLKYSKNEASL